MKTYKISILSLLLALLFLAGCSDRKKFFEDERYEKMVYIVSDNNNIHNLVYDLDGKDGNIRNLSIACSGTNPTEEPVTISLTEDTVLLDEYNYTNFIEDYSRRNSLSYSKKERKCIITDTKEKQIYQFRRTCKL